MRSPLAANTAIVLTAVEESLARASMIDRDVFFRRRSGKGEYTPVELAKQHVIWTAQIGQSMLIEISAIVVHSLCVVLFLPHRFAFNLGYGEAENTGIGLSVVLLSTLLELTGELLTDHMALRAEMEHGVPADTFFEYLNKNTHISKFGGALLLATGLVLWTFSRMPTAAFCDDVNPCSCLNDEGTSNFEIYRSVCTCTDTDLLGGFGNQSNSSTRSVEGEAATCSNLTSMSARFETNPVASVDSDVLVPLAIALCAIIATAALVFFSVSNARNRKSRRRVQAAVTMQKKRAMSIIQKQTQAVQTAQKQVVKMQEQLQQAKNLVKQVMAEEGAALNAFHLDYRDIDFGGEKIEDRFKLGEGS